MFPALCRYLGMAKTDFQLEKDNELVNAIRLEMARKPNVQVGWLQAFLIRLLMICRFKLPLVNLSAEQVRKLRCYID